MIGYKYELLEIERHENPKKLEGLTWEEALKDIAIISCVNTGKEYRVPLFDTVASELFDNYYCILEGETIFANWLESQTFERAIIFSLEKRWPVGETHIYEVFDKFEEYYYCTVLNRPLQYKL